MSDREAQNVTVREAQRREIAAQVEEFLRHGGRIDIVDVKRHDRPEPVGRVWWEVSGSVLN